MGTGLDMRAPAGLALDSDGTILVIEPGRDRVLRIDPVTGDRVVVSSAEVGEGPIFHVPRRISVVPGAPADTSGPSPQSFGLLVAVVGIVAFSIFWVRRKRGA